jgi:2-oxoglutarate dehydrogenase E2 component (dihydrolipoamide succinyltransferase)
VTTVNSTETTVPLPELGESVTEATVTRWLKKVGDEIAVDEPILEVSTDKVDTEVVSPVAGTLLRIVVDEDGVATVGEPLAILGQADASAAPPESAPVETPEPADQEEPSNGSEQPEPAPALVVDSDPVVSAPSPAVAPPSDAARTAPQNTGAGATIEKLPRIRQTIARRMMESLHSSAQLTTVVEADVSVIAAERERRKAEFLQQTGIKLSFLPYFVRAAVDALAGNRVINASLNADATEVTYHHACHLGIAVDGPKGLMVPVIQHAENLSVGGLARAIAGLASRVRNNSVEVDELSGGTFTITNTGSRGALFDTPIINQPQSAILGVGAIVDRVVPIRVDGSINFAVRSTAYLSLSYDHRIVDGADAARYLTAVKARLETAFTDPVSL